MRMWRVGGAFIGGLVLFIVAGAVEISRGAIGIDNDLQPLFAASLGLTGAGAAVLAMTRPPALRGRSAMLGLTGIAGGCVVLAFAVLSWGSLRGIELAFLLIPMVGGGGAVGFGTLAVALSAIRTRGPWRWAGLALIVGIALVLLGTWGDTARPLGAMAQTLMAVGGTVIIGGAVGVGVLASLSPDAELSRPGRA